MLRLTRFLVEEPGLWLSAAVRALPGRLGVAARRVYYALRLERCGAGLWTETGVRVLSPRAVALGAGVTLLDGVLLAAQDGRLEVGDQVSINRNAVVDASGKGEIVLGRGVLIGPNCVLRASDHEFSDARASIKSQGHRGGRIVLEDDVWLGANVVVTAGATIGKGSVIGAGSVVTGDIAPGSIAVGAPARAIKSRA